MRVLMVAPEVHPLAKTGGLADVLAALPRALGRLGVDLTVCLPAYRSALRAAGRVESVARLAVPVSCRTEPADVLRLPDAPLPTVLVRHDRYFDRDAPYGDAGGDFPDNAERFAFLCRAVLEWLRGVRPRPDVIHVHDWPTALVPAFLRAGATHYPELDRVRTVLTIHNLAYQGRMAAGEWHLLNLDPRYFGPEFLEFYGQINYLKAGLVFAEAITTVSPRYAQEILTPARGEGLDGVLVARRTRLHGILNGIDTAEWDPATDPHLPAGYDLHDLRGKARCKAGLRAEVGLGSNPDAPLLAVVSRFVEQKGIDLLEPALPPILSADGAQLVVLGSGEMRYERQLRRLASRFPGRVALRFGFDEALAHRIEAGADLFLMPSRFEPCGLNQLYSLRYGTVPVVHATGGLDDSVVDYDPDTDSGTGFKFRDHTPEALRGAVARALALWQDGARWLRLVRRGMAEDVSWDRAARQYHRLYENLPPPAAAPF
jgi:starch synthase